MRPGVNDGGAFVQERKTEDREYRQRQRIKKRINKQVESNGNKSSQATTAGLLPTAA
jgi:hypothetical protein